MEEIADILDLNGWDAIRCVSVSDEEPIAGWNVCILWSVASFRTAASVVHLGESMTSLLNFRRVEVEDLLEMRLDSV